MKQFIIAFTFLLVSLLTALFGQASSAQTKSDDAIYKVTCEFLLDSLVNMTALLQDSTSNKLTNIDHWYYDDTNQFISKETMAILKTKLININKKRESLSKVYPSYKLLPSKEKKTDDNSFYSVSKIAYTSDNRIAIVYADYHYKISLGSGYILILKKVRNKWAIVFHENIWGIID